MATLSKLKPSDVLYDVHSQKMGNTTMTTMGVWTVMVKEVHDTHIVASWNGNPPRKMYEGEVGKLRVNRPVMIRSAFGRSRLATRAEIKAMKEKEDANS
jgi:hypothetical protein